MDRRRLLTMAAALPLATALTGRAGSASIRARRVRPQDPEWPSPAEWDALRRRVGGRLLEVESPLAACAHDPAGAACQGALKDLRNPYFIHDQAGATQSSGWVDAWTTAPSVYAVAAQDASDVAAAINFARERNLRLVVKGGGHSYQGTSNVPDSLLIWTQAMNGIALHDAFIGESCAAAAAQPAVSIGAGALWLQAYEAVTVKAGRYVQGGGCTTVGVAGLIQSGGFGSFSKNYGMAASSLLEAEIVTADDAIRIANACSNPDLFWAIKGGGGGSFGVVTRMTLRTHDLPQWFGAAIFTVKAASDAAFRRLIGEFVGFYKDRLFNPHWGESVGFAPDNTLSVSMVAQGLDTQEIGAVWQPLLDWIAASAQDFSVPGARIIGSMPARSWWDAGFLKANLPSVIVSDDRPGPPPGNFWWASNQNEVGAFWHGYQSLWLPDSLLETDQVDRFADALFAASRQWRVSLHFNKGLAGAPAAAVAAARETATNPAVQRAFALAIIAAVSARTYPGVGGHEPDLAQARRHAEAIARAMDELRKVAPEPGSYVSESNFFEPDWQRSYWGDNYPRLQAVKAKYDPDGLFFVHHGVGSEIWSADGFVPSDGR